VSQQHDNNMSEDIRELRRDLGKLRERIRSLETHQEMSQWRMQTVKPTGLDPALIGIAAKLALAIMLPALIWLATGKADTALSTAHQLLK